MEKLRVFSMGIRGNGRRFEGGVSSRDGGGGQAGPQKQGGSVPAGNRLLAACRVSGQAVPSCLKRLFQAPLDQGLVGALVGGATGFCGASDEGVGAETGGLAASGVLVACGAVIGANEGDGAGEDAGSLSSIALPLMRMGLGVISGSGSLYMPSCTSPTGTRVMIRMSEVQSTTKDSRMVSPLEDGGR